jgi:hypothetical protein
MNPSEITTQESDYLSSHSTSIFTILGFLCVVALWQTFIPWSAPPEETENNSSTTFTTTPLIPKAFPHSPKTVHAGSDSDRRVIENMAQYLTQNPGVTHAPSAPTKSSSASRLFDIDLDNASDFLPENSEKLAHRMTQIADEHPNELAKEFKKTFSELFWNHAEQRERLLQLARYVGDSASGDQVKEVVLQQASLFIPSENTADLTFGRNSFQAYLDMEKDPVKRKLGASRITSVFVELTGP